MTERTFNIDTLEYKNLKRAADIMTTMSDGSSVEYVVQDCYFDFDQDWMWTTIIKINHKEKGILRSCQAITPRDWKLIIAAESKKDLLEIMKSIIK